MLRGSWLWLGVISLALADASEVLGEPNHGVLVRLNAPRAELDPQVLAQRDRLEQRESTALHGSLGSTPGEKVRTLGIVRSGFVKVQPCPSSVLRPSERPAGSSNPVG
jgi:hypothetical protein